ncbi:hypothetical protein TPE_0333 [Treponema pedis str. T A4]|uniref:Uncharacterized protein n=1 Tax=Treponema pedis str. T A4 TaxID=1291379 RepID=S6A7X2_9SPIR|nr:hypothetical protein TPE_0333 [Treponema pedis str. T A4]
MRNNKNYFVFKFYIKVKSNKFLKTASFILLKSAPPALS